MDCGGVGLPLREELTYPLSAELQVKLLKIISEGACDRGIFFGIPLKVLHDQFPPCEILSIFLHEITFLQHCLLLHLFVLLLSRVLLSH
jgi:hypothetical protein